MSNKNLTKDEYVGEYLELKMKNCKLTYGMRYFNLLAKHTERAEKNYENTIKKRLEK